MRALRVSGDPETGFKVTLPLIRISTKKVTNGILTQDS